MPTSIRAWFRDFPALVCDDGVMSCCGDFSTTSGSELARIPTSDLPPVGAALIKTGDPVVRTANLLSLEDSVISDEADENVKSDADRIKQAELMEVGGAPADGAVASGERRAEPAGMEGSRAGEPTFSILVLVQRFKDFLFRVPGRWAHGHGRWWNVGGGVEL